MTAVTETVAQTDTVMMRRNNVGDIDDIDCILLLMKQQRLLSTDVNLFVWNDYRSLWNVKFCDVLWEQRYLTARGAL